MTEIDKSKIEQLQKELAELKESIRWRNAYKETPPETCDINDLELWVSDNVMGFELVYGQFSDGKYTAMFQTNDEGEYITRKVQPSFWRPADHVAHVNTL